LSLKREKIIMRDSGGGTWGLVLAAGQGERAGGGLPKQYRRLAGEAIVARAAAALLHHPKINGVAVVIALGQGDLYRQACAHLPLPDPIEGGAERQDSVRLGLEALAPRQPDRVLIHDAARPFLPGAVIDRLLEILDHGPAALPVLPVVDTLKRVEAGTISATVDRAGLVRAQTPQAFHFATILQGHRDLAGQSLTDDTALAERAGLTVSAVAGDESLFKITRPEDFERAARHLSSGYETRTGTGFDVHRLGAGDHVMLCGVAIPHDQGLLGHSDADVALHALTDALLGAIAAGDVGAHFPPSEAQWRGAASDRFVAHAAGLLRAQGGEIINTDVTLVCERPKIGPHRQAMRARIAGILRISIDRVSVKATTTERLGFTGRAEGIAAQASASVRMPINHD
jgi:2-C-methyl-D-erythritol 4-phosphate cytidylyltransferase/2-C-methyl-D-erythritol 2,4-cyclodiphosphate synthase